MKQLLLSVGLVLSLPLLSPQLSAENAKKAQKKMKLPDFLKVLNDEKLITKTPSETGITYIFASNRSLAELKPVLLKALGDGWSMEAIPERILQNIKREDPSLLNISRLTHANQTRYSLVAKLLTIPKKEKEAYAGFKHRVQIAVVDLKKAKLQEKDFTVPVPTLEVK